MPPNLPLTVPKWWRARVRRGVTQWVVPAVSAETFGTTLAMREYHGAALAFGLHPVYVHLHQDAHLVELAQWLQREQPVAVGEIGLDLFVPGLDVTRQIELFEAQLKLARDFDLPVIVHIRRSQDQVLKYLRKWKVKGGIATRLMAASNRLQNLSSLVSNWALVAP